MRNSLYWDDFLRRSDETSSCIISGGSVPIRRVAVFVTDRCNLRCAYCNVRQHKSEMTESTFDSIVKRHGKDAIIHITGGEPSVVPWLYPYLEKNGCANRFHLNTNALITPPYQSIKRLKVSLDSCDPDYWNDLVGRAAFEKVLKNIQKSINHTVVSVTYTMTKENYTSIPKFIKFAQEELDGIYAIFFSVYKGTNPRFVFKDEDVADFFTRIKPQMDFALDVESKALLNETIGEKFRIMQGIRFPENNTCDTCFLSLSERVYSCDGTASGCSHLYRDGIRNEIGQKHEKCKYGCNRRLVAFNEIVAEKIARTKRGGAESQPLTAPAVH